MPLARSCSGEWRRLVGKSRKRDSGHGFNSGLAWEKESEEGNAFKGLLRGAGGRGRRTMVRRGTTAMVTASKLHGGKAGKKGGKRPATLLTQGGTPAAARGNKGAARRRQRWRSSCGGQQRG
jgi:hypothetical protein